MVEILEVTDLSKACLELDSKVGPQTARLETETTQILRKASLKICTSIELQINCQIV